MLGSDYSTFGCYENKSTHGRQVLGGQHNNLQGAHPCRKDLCTTFQDTEIESCCILKKRWALWQQMPPTRVPQSLSLFSSSSVKWPSLRASSSSLNKVVSHCVVPVLHKTARNLQIFLYSKYYKTLTINSKPTRVKYWNALLYLTYSNCLVQYCLCISCIIWTRQHGVTEVGLQQEVCFCVWTVKWMGIDFNWKMFCQFTVHLIFIVSHGQICVLISILKKNKINHCY